MRNKLIAGYSLAILLLVIGLAACNNSKQSPTNSKITDASAAEIKRLISRGRRVENSYNDSLKIVATQLRQLSNQTGDKNGLVYSELFEANYYWQAADHKQAMQIAIKGRADGEKFNVKAPLIELYGTIANLHKETTNYPMAFAAADNGLAIAVAEKDTAHTIALLGLKAMFTRALTLNKGKGQSADKSIDLNLAALQMAESSPKYLRLRTRFYDNICQYYKDMRDFKKAHYYGDKGITSAIQNNQKRSLTYAYSWMGQVNYFEGKHPEGIALLNKAAQIAADLKEPYRVMEIHGHIYDCYISTNDYKNALLHYRRMQNMRDSLKVLDNVKQISELQLKYEAVQKDKTISDLHAKTKIEWIVRDAVIIVLFLLIIIVILIYVKEKKGKYLLISEKLLLDEELKSAELELLYFTDNLKQKNEIIEEFKAKIEHLQFQHITTADRENLDNLIKAHIMTDESWDSFRKLFSKVHTGFFDILKRKYPQLTATDTRILSLIKLQLSNYEMANMLGITIEGVKKSKQRLRKKMELDKDMTLENTVVSM